MFVCAQLCLPFCNPLDCNLPGSSVHGIFQTRILEWVAKFPPPKELPNSGIKPASLMPPALAGGHCATWEEASKVEVQFSSVAQSCLALCDPMDCSTSGLPVYHQLPEFTQTHVH